MARHYLVTFDIEKSANKTHLYRQVESTLRFRYGDDNVLKSLKQFYIVKYDRPVSRGYSGPAAEIRDLIRQKLGYDCNILVVRLQKGYASKIKKIDVRIKTHAFLQEIV